MQEKLFSF